MHTVLENVSGLWSRDLDSIYGWSMKKNRIRLLTTLRLHLDDHFWKCHLPYNIQLVLSPDAIIYLSF